MFTLSTSSLFYHARTIYLFTCDDLVAILLTNTASGSVLAMTDSALSQPMAAHDVFWRLPQMCLWIWVNLLFFNLSNQSQPGAMLEDGQNKPWRPLPSKRITFKASRNWGLVVSLVAITGSTVLGGTVWSIALQILTFFYNDLNGGEHWLSRNPLNASGYLCFALGAMDVAARSLSHQYSNQALKWLGSTWIIIASTIHIQDLYDQAGDRMKNRKTLPLVWGDATARGTAALFVFAWSTVMPATFQSRCGSIPALLLGATVALRLMMNGVKDVRHDKRTFIYWNLWIISIHMLPFWAQFERAG